jgi:AbiV family abortive infection protein
LTKEPTENGKEPKSFIIPVNKLNEGLRVCANNIRRFLLDIERLVQDVSDWHAVALAIFAFEELAKYSELKRAKEAATSSIVRVDRRLFWSHKYKQEIARKLVPLDAVELFPAGFNRQAFNSTFWNMETISVSPSLRLDCVFVNWENGEWTHGSPILPERLKSFCKAILDALNHLELTGEFRSRL